MKKVRVTIYMEEELARWVKVEAARKGVDVSRFVSRIVRNKKKKEAA